ncbi:MAG TPA: UDP-3-O-(3-hydroxymyristoyl)glucosamine N-acyltransferase [Thermoanaerobaculia bacterium]|nr:UDP-3-O-(3-hydroxymyristoyl)glucosamine N-acyltransferase [Thermoanaerobaculia bacterium]
MPAVPILDIVVLVGGRYGGPPDVALDGIAPLSEATPRQLSFLANPKYAAQVATTRAGAILVAEDYAGGDTRLIRVKNPYLAMASVAAKWFAARRGPRGISPLASVSPSAKLGNDVNVGAFATIGDDVTIGDGVTIYPNVAIAPGCAIGDGTTIYPLVSIYEGTTIGRRCILHSGVVVGSDGYGFATEGGRHHKVPQIGSVRIEDDVEIGSNTTIDRGTIGETVIGEGTKIDNLVQIGHGVKIGKHCLLVAQVGIAGSTELGDSVVVAGQSGFAGHLRIGNRVQVGAKSAVLADVPDDTKVMGSPAMPFREFARREATLKRMMKKKD